LITEINAEAAAGGSEITASLTNGTNGNFQIQANGSYTFAVKPHDGSESSNALAIMGVNTFFSWTEDTSQPVADITQTLGVNSALKSDLKLIAAGKLDNNNNVAQGSNNVALAIASLQDKVISNLGGSGINSTLDSYYSSFIADVGIDAENTDSNKTYNSTLLDQYTQKKESVVGVNLDEEMTDILKNQQLYQAAAKIISMCDDMLDTLLSTR
jgi:flagellar hook-associated protein 1